MATQTNNSNPELLRAMNSLTKAIDGISKSMAGSQNNSSGPGRPRGSSPGSSQKIQDRAKQKTADQEFERNRRLARNQEKHFLDLASEIHDYTRSITKLNSQSNKGQADYKKLLDSQNTASKSLLEHNKMSLKYQDQFVDQMTSVLKSSKTFQNLKLKSTSTDGRINEIVNMQDSMNDVLAKVSGVKQKTGAKNLSDLQTGDIKSIIKSMNGAGTQVEGMSNEKFLNDLGKHDGKVATAKRKIAKETGKSGGPDPVRLAKLQENLAIAAEHRSKFVDASFGKAIKNIEGFNKSVGKNTLVNFGLSQSTEIANKAIEKLGGNGISLASGFAMMYKAVVDYTKYTISLANRQMGGWHFQLAKDALAMGTSTDATIKYFTEMAHQISQHGPTAVRELYAANKETFNNLGLYGDEALAFATKASQNFELMGVTAKDAKVFNATMKSYGANLNRMSKLTGLSVDHLMDLDNALIKSTESSSMMMRVSAQERGSKMNAIVAERNRMIQLGMTSDAAQRFISTLQSIQQARPSDRIDNSANIMQLSQTLNMGASGAKLAALMQRKRFDQMDETEKKFYIETSKEIGARLQKLKGAGDLSTQEYAFNLEDSIKNSHLKDLLNQGAEGKLAEETKGKIDVDSATAKKIEDDKQINGYLSKILDLGTTMQNAFGNPAINLLTGILAGVSLIGAILAKDSLIAGGKKALAAFGKPGGKGPGGKVVLDPISDSLSKSSSSIPSGAAGDAGKAASKGLGKSILKKIPLIGLGAGALFAMGRIVQGDYLGAAGEVASGAASTIPGVGTTASFAIDAAMIARDVNKSSGVVDAIPVESKKQQISQPSANELNNAQPQSINNESNENKKNASLEDLAAKITAGTEGEQSKLDEMIALLKTLIEVAKPENNGLIDAIKSGAASKISFNDLHDKRSLFATK